MIAKCTPSAPLRRFAVGVWNNQVADTNVFVYLMSCRTTPCRSTLQRF